MLKQIFFWNSPLRSDISNVVVADIVNQNTHLFVDIAEEIIKKILRRVLPLVISSILLGGLSLYEWSLTS